MCSSARVLYFTACAGKHAFRVQRVNDCTGYVLRIYIGHSCNLVTVKLYTYCSDCEVQTTSNRPVHVKHERIHYCHNEGDVMAGVHSSAILAGICIAFYGNVVQL